MIIEVKPLPSAFVCAVTLTDAMGHYQFLDLAPKGRDEAGLPFPMTWVKLHDQYPQ